MTVRDALARITLVQIPDGSPPVVRSAAQVVGAMSGAAILESEAREPASRAGVFQIAAPVHAAARGGLPAARIDTAPAPGRVGPPRQAPAAECSTRPRVPGGRAWPTAISAPSRHGVSITPDVRVEPFVLRRVPDPGGAHPAGPRPRVVRAPARARGDSRTPRSTPSPSRWASRRGPKGEIYPMFYTYCPALDQFVSSSLNKGLYPFYYLSANLAVLKRNAALARTYGLVPGLFCVRAPFGARGVLRPIPDAAGPARRSPVPFVSAALHDDAHAPARLRALRGHDDGADAGGAGPRLPRRSGPTTAAPASNTPSRSMSAATAAPT